MNSVPSYRGETALLTATACRPSPTITTRYLRLRKRHPTVVLKEGSFLWPQTTTNKQFTVIQITTAIWNPIQGAASWQFLFITLETTALLPHGMNEHIWQDMPDYASILIRPRRQTNESSQTGSSSWWVSGKPFCRIPGAKTGAPLFPAFPNLSGIPSQGNMVYKSRLQSRFLTSSPQTHIHRCPVPPGNHIVCRDNSPHTHPPAHPSAHECHTHVG